MTHESLKGLTVASVNQSTDKVALFAYRDNKANENERQNLSKTI